MSHTHIVRCLKIAGFLTEEAKDVGEMLVPYFVEDLRGFRCLAKEHLPLGRREAAEVESAHLILGVQHDF